MITEARCKKCNVKSAKLSVLSFVFAILSSFSVSDDLKVWRKILHGGSEIITIIYMICELIYVYHINPALHVYLYNENIFMFYAALNCSTDYTKLGWSR